MKAISAAVVLFCLIALCDLAYSAPKCGANGVQDSYATKYCSCFSGYAPSDKYQNDCDYEAPCPFYPAVDTHDKVGGYQPILYSTSFSADRYNVIVRIPIVENRRNATVRFSSGAATCGYPGNLWAKSVDTLDCMDEFVGSMPWSSHGLCGFNTKIALGAKTAFTNSLVVTYDDYITDSEGDFIRTMGVLLNINVTFVTQSKLIFSLVDLTSGVTYITVQVIGDVLYDANTVKGTVTIRTKASWPYSVSSISMFSTPYPNLATLYPDLNYDTTIQCSNTTKSDCFQQYVMLIDPNQGCNIGGLYTFNITLGCRAGVCGGASYSSGSYSVRIYDTDICGSGGIDVSLSNAELLPFADAAGSQPTASFVPNAMVYFTFSITSDDATIDTLTLDEISAQTNDVADVLYDSSQYGLTVKGSAAQMVITPATVPVAAGTPVTLLFQLKLVDAVSSFRVLPSSAATVTMTVIVSITYHGGSKRSEKATMSVTSSKGMSDLYLSNGGGGGVGSALVTDSSSTVTPFPPIFFLLLTFVLMVALRY